MELKLNTLLGTTFQNKLYVKYSKEDQVGPIGDFFVVNTADSLLIKGHVYYNMQYFLAYRAASLDLKEPPKLILHQKENHRSQRYELYIDYNSPKELVKKLNDLKNGNRKHIRFRQDHI